MKIVIVGCGRVGSSAAELWDRAGHEVIILDESTRAFERLPTSFSGHAVRGDGTDEDVLRRAGIEGADIFLALTEGDNRNVMAAQLAHEAFDVHQVVAKLNDPVRAEAYADLGIATLCRTNLMSDAINVYLDLPTPSRSGVLTPTGSHPGGEHHDLDTAGAAGGTPEPVAPAPPGAPYAPATGGQSRTEN